MSKILKDTEIRVGQWVSLDGGDIAAIECADGAGWFARVLDTGELAGPYRIWELQAYENEYGDTRRAAKCIRCGRWQSFASLEEDGGFCGRCIEDAYNVDDEELPFTE